MARLIVLPVVDDDLLQSVAYIAHHNEPAAIRWYESIRALFRKLAASRFLGEACSTPRHRDARRISHGNYVVYYRPIEDGVEILRVLHGARDHRKLI